MDNKRFLSVIRGDSIIGQTPTAMSSDDAIALDDMLHKLDLLDDDTEIAITTTF